MNERQEQFIEDSMIGDEFASAVSAHDIELESPLVGEEGLARLANGQVRPIEVTINQDIRSDTDPDEIARLVSSMLTPIEDTRGNDELDQVRMALEEIATHVKPHIAHAPFTSIACAVDDALHELGQYEASLSQDSIVYHDVVPPGHPAHSMARAELQRYLTSQDLRAIDLDELMARLAVGSWEVDLVAERSAEQLTWRAFATTAHGGEQKHGWPSIGAILAHYAHRPVIENADQ